MRAYALLAGVVLFPATSLASNDWAKTASSSGTIGYLAFGIGLSYFRDGKEGQDHAIRAADSVLTSVLIAEGMKSFIRDRRPDNSDWQSFPSAHASGAFALASMLSRYHPKEAPLWYAGAATIGYSRIVLKAHRPIDVIAGAGLGYGITALEIGCKRGLLAYPFVAPTDHGLVLALRGTW
jgi:membrane-associated phospholipid phosphatase